MHHIVTITLQGSIEQMRQRIAIEQGAMHKASLAVARWRQGPAFGGVAEDMAASNVLSASLAAQARWHAQLQCQFICWLESGGFALEDRQATAESAVSPATAGTGTGATASASASAATTATTAAPVPVSANAALLVRHKGCTA